MVKSNFSDQKPHFSFMQEQSFYQPSYEAISTLGPIDWKTPGRGDVKDWWEAKRVCIDVEARDEQLRELGPGCRRDPTKNYVVGYAVAVEDGPSWYLPIKHLGGDNCEWDVRGWMREQIKRFNGELILNGAGYDLDWTATDLQDDSILKKSITDPQVIDPLIYELYDRYNLDELCLRYGLPGKDEDLLSRAAAVWRTHPKTGLWKLPARFVAQYGMVDARRPLQVVRRQEPKIAEEKIERIWAIEKKVTPILVKMRRRGVRIDYEHLQALVALSIKKQDEHLALVRQECGITVKREDIWKAAVLAHALRAAGYEPPKTERKVSEKTKRWTGGKDSVDADFLAGAGKVGKNLLRARKWAKLRDFCRQVSEAAINHGDEWRVHCTFNQLKTTSEQDSDESKGVRYGRLSSDNFNVQQMPVRDPEFGEMFRQIFVADRGAQWGCSDWSQQEPRIGVHYAEIIERITRGRECRGAKEFADEYRSNPRLDIHAKLTEIALGEKYNKQNPFHVQKRTEVKNYVNGRLYGMGDTKLCWELGWETETIFDKRWNNGQGGYREVPTAESAERIKGFVEFAPWIPGLTRSAMEAAERQGFVVTFLGRKLHFMRGPDGKWWKLHKAFNRVGQGSAADQMKATLVACDEEGLTPDLAVHDEFDFSFYDIKDALRVSELQRDTVKFNVPMMVDLEIGPSWGQLTKYVAPSA